MEEEKLVGYFSKQMELYNKRLARVGKKQDPENIHKLRLSIKKLRSILRMVEIAGKGKFSKKAHFDLLSKVFSEAGKVREIQMNLELIHQQKGAKAIEYDAYFEKKLKRSITNLKAVIGEFDKKKLRRLNKRFLRLSTSLKSDRVARLGLRFMRKRYDYVNTTIRKNGDPELLHKVRINLKMMLETLIILRKVRSTQMMEKVKGELAVLNQHLGEWHDYQVLIEALKTIKSGPKKGLSKNRVSKLLKGNKKKERQLRKGTVREVYDHISKFKLGKSMQFT